MRELYASVSQGFSFGNLAKILKRNSQKLRTVVAVMAMMVVSCGLWAQIQVGDTLWYETWTGGATSATPSAYDFSGTTVYGGATLTYAQTADATKLYNEALAGGTAPELLLSKNSQSWTITNLPTAGVYEMSLTFLANKNTFSVTSATEGIAIEGSAKSWTITAESTVENFEIVITNTGSANARMDNILLAVTALEAPLEPVANPTFLHPTGTYTNSVEVSISCATDGASIYYTVNGDDPTTESTLYSAAFTITETTTVKAIAAKTGMANSEVVTAEYTITNMEVVATPVITPEAGNYNEPQQITITCATDEALIYYTTDGTEPTAESTLYDGPFTLSVSAIVKAIAVKEGYTDSGMASAEYTMPVFLENLAAVYSTANNDQYRVLGDVTFVFRSGRYMFVKDATAGMMIYDYNTPVITNTYENGDIISGGISGKTTIYNGLYELVPTADIDASTENNGAVEPIVVTIPQMSNEND